MIELKRSKQREKIIDALKRGLFVAKYRTERGDHFALSDGSKVPQGVLARLFECGALTPNNDALFGESQTFSLREDVAFKQSRRSKSPA